jgi:hypothetical protein
MRIDETLPFPSKKDKITSECETLPFSSKKR